MGFQPLWDPEERELIVAHVVGQLSKGVPLTTICQPVDMPAVETIYDWAQRAPDTHGAAIARARAAGFDAIAQRARLTLRGCGPEKGGDATGDVARDKAIAEFDLKLLAKWDPKRYGDAFQLRHADADGEKLDTAPLISEMVALVRGVRARIEGSAPDALEGPTDGD